MQSRLVHWRVLVGPPHRQVLKDHLIRLLDLRDPADRTYGMQTLHLGMVEDQIREPERFFVASESQAVVTIPCLQSQIGRDRYLRSWRAAQVAPAVGLSVDLRQRPVRLL
jgi:hypothetical protein